MAQLLQFSSPVMSGRTGLHPNQARWLLPKECQQLAPRQAALHDNCPSRINAMY
jgi:hypothetical protein